MGSAVSRFITRDEEERSWVLDMHARVEPVMRMSSVFAIGLMVVCAPWLAHISYIPMLVGGVGLVVGSKLVFRWQRIEPMVVAWLFVQAMVVLAAVINAAHFGPETAALPVGLVMTLWPMMSACVRFPGRVVAVCAGYTATLMAGALLTFGTSEVVAYPPMVLIPVVMLITVVWMAQVLRRASMEHRSAAVMDHLTGMLNRSALASRAAELAHQSTLTGERVGVIVADLDHFKRVNDTHGHAAGDVVLQETAYRMRKELGAFDLAYRIGGEEFAVLLPGADESQAHATAGRLWSVLRGTPISGLQITASFGVGVSEAGEAFDFDHTFRAADAALYRAKREGRDRICFAAPVASAAPERSPDLLPWTPHPSESISASPN